MGTILVALGILLVGGLGALATSPRPRTANAVGSITCAAACAIGLLSTAAGLGGPAQTLRRAWSVPYGELALGIDPLSRLFLLIVFAVCLAGAVYGAAYLPRVAAGRWLGPPWFFFSLLAASMAVVVMARNGVLFLVAWEAMALASFLLVTFESDHASVRDAGRLYLIATHVGTAFLLALFASLAARTGSMDFGLWHEAAPGGPPVLLFLLALAGFGTKAGLVPFHVWLPEAHPAAPSHVSAVMSGVMIQMGIYGLIRTLGFLGPPQVWWGGVLLAVGIVSALIGVLHALVQQDIKRLLAYSSVENVGLVTIGLGMGLIGVSAGRPVLAALGFAGALLHTVNHAVFKSLLFLGAGAVAERTGTRQIDRLGGLMKTMPATGVCVFAGAIAICGFPPLNGFIGELVLFRVSYEGLVSMQGTRALLPVASLVGLALAGGLSAACFLRLFGVVFLGVPRGAAPAPAGDPPLPMRASMIALAVACAAMGLIPTLLLTLVTPAAGAVAGPDAFVALADFAAEGVASRIVVVDALLLALIGALVLLRRWVLSRRRVAESFTWDCGFEAPGARMQYTAASFGEPLREMFSMLLPARRREVSPEGYFPTAASLHSEIVRPFQERLYRPAFAAVGRWMSGLRWLHHGRVQLYVLYIVVTLIMMLSWLLFYELPQ